MFEDESEIIAFLEEAGLADHLSFFETVCRPSLCFEARRTPNAKAGASRLGGRPDLPSTIAWPVRASYPNGKVLADTLARRGPELTDAFLTPMPLDFVGQLDLKEVARAEILEDCLPDSGRLLFFWDTTCGPWVDSMQSCHVLWDTSPKAVLAPRDPPAPGLAIKSYPTKPIAFRPVWSLPDRLLLKELVEDEDLRAALEDEDYDGAWDDIMDRGTTQLASGREVLPHRLCGWPMPEQWDPRFTAVASARGVASLFERQPTEDERAQCTREMHTWTLLLQVGLSDIWQEYAEGTVYFVMRQEDLEARNFDRVHAVYQQT